MDRPELMAEIDRRWHLVDDLVQGAGAPDLERTAGGAEAPPEGWTVAEVLLHMAGWKRRALEVAQLFAARPDLTDDEANDRLFTGWRDYNAGHRGRAQGVTLEAVLAEHRAAHADLLRAIDSLPDRCLLADGRGRGWLRPVMAHTFDHLDPDLRPALQR